MKRTILDSPSALEALRSQMEMETRVGATELGIALLVGIIGTLFIKSKFSSKKGAELDEKVIEQKQKSDAAVADANSSADDFRERLRKYYEQNPDSDKKTNND